MKELSEVLQDWEAVIGLEIHTELTALDTKMFCNCKLSHDDEPQASNAPQALADLLEFWKLQVGQLFADGFESSD